jgi:hypothetical protein
MFRTLLKSLAMIATVYIGKGIIVSVAGASMSNGGKWWKWKSNEARIHETVTR